jgi:hypothetical protein
MIESLVDFWLAVRGLMWVLVALAALTLLAFILDASERLDDILRGSGDNDNQT